MRYMKSFFCYFYHLRNAVVKVWITNWQNIFNIHECEITRFSCCDDLLNNSLPNLISTNMLSIRNSSTFCCLVLAYQNKLICDPNLYICSLLHLSVKCSGFQTSSSQTNTFRHQSILNVLLSHTLDWSIWHGRTDQDVHTFPVCIPLLPNTSWY